MDHFTLTTLRRVHPAWRLLAAENAPLILGFLHKAFVEPNVRTADRQELVSKLDDHLFHLREHLGEDAFPRAATQYLDDWASDDHGWLRKYYVAGSDEPHYDLTPATEKAIAWVVGLQQQQFVTTESRLMTVFELLRQIQQGTQADPEARIAELMNRRATIDAEIQRIRGGHLDLMDGPQVKDRFLQMSATARGLLSDFREVEQNFRDLDRAVRERIATWDGAKGALLDDIFGQRDAIADSDQGRSFHAFWTFLMSPARQEELSALLETVLALESVQDLHPDPRLRRIHYDWLEAGEVAQRTVAHLSQQLRRYLDDQVWLENRRVMQLIHGIEQHALALREGAPEGAFAALDTPSPDVELTMERPLFTPPLRPNLNQSVVVDAGGEVPTDALFEQVYVDRRRLSERIRRALQTQRQVTLAALLDEHPLEHGLAELVTYVSLASDDVQAVIDEAQRETVTWADPTGAQRQATLPRIIFCR